MSVTLDDGGPAFPQTVSAVGNGVRTYWGMSLRDYFSAAALSSYLEWGKRDSDGELHKYPDVARSCYDMADAMLKAREQKSCACSET